MSDARKRISNPFTGRKKRTAWNKKSKCFSQNKKSTLALTDQGSYYNQEKWLEEYNYGFYYNSFGSSDDEECEDPLNYSDSDYSSTDEDSENEYENIQSDLEKEVKINDSISEDLTDPSNSFAIISPTILQNMLLQQACCKFCEGEIHLKEKLSSCQSLGRVWVLVCSSANCTSPSTESTAMTPKINNRFQVNEAFVLACRSVGRGHSAARKLTSIMNLQQPVSRHCWRRHTLRLSKRTETILEKNLVEEAIIVKKYLMNTGSIKWMSEKQLAEEVVKTGVSVDGSWGSRGWCSSDGIVDVCFEETGKVLDVIMKFSSCTQCKKMKFKKEKGEISYVEYLEWYNRHETDCLMNHEGSSSAVESSGALALFQRSKEKLGLIYETYIGDGDSKSYSTVSLAQPYGPLQSITKEECTAHITKRMGTGLREIVKTMKGKKLSDGKSIQGKGRLTINRINTFQNFYGLAIRKNKGDSEAMAKNTKAILNHYSSTIENPKHDQCPQGKDSWCSYNRDLATGEQQHVPIKDPLSEAIVEVVKPLFDRLGNKDFLYACENCKTQNVNESYHHVVWSMAPKDVYQSPWETKLAVELATIVFNKGLLATLSQVCQESNFEVSDQMIKQWESIDSDRYSKKASQNYEAVKQQRKKRKKSRAKEQDAFIHLEGTQYKSGAFHPTDNSKQKKEPK